MVRNSRFPRYATAFCLTFILLFSCALPASSAATPLPRPECPEYGAVSAGQYFTAYLSPQGTVTTSDPDYYDTSRWANIVAIDAGFDHIAGLKADGTVVSAKTSYNLSGWKNIVAISAGCGFTLGLKADGTVVAKGDNSSGQGKVSRWKNIVAISAGYDHAVGLKADGTVVVTGANQHGELDVTDWTDIIQVSTCYFYTIGLKSDGTVIVAGSPQIPGDIGPSGQLSWDNITAVSAGYDKVYGLNRAGDVHVFRTVPSYSKGNAQQVLDWGEDQQIISMDAGVRHLACKGYYENELYFTGGGQYGETDACRLLGEMGYHTYTKKGTKYVCIVCGFQAGTKSGSGYCSHYPSSEWDEGNALMKTWVCNHCSYVEKYPYPAADWPDLEGRIILDKKEYAPTVNVQLTDDYRNFKGMTEYGVHYLLNSQPDQLDEGKAHFHVAGGGYWRAKIIAGSEFSPNARMDVRIFLDDDILLILPNLDHETDLFLELVIPDGEILTIECSAHSDTMAHMIIKGDFYS